jgi:hypothetical protein
MVIFTMLESVAKELYILKSSRLSQLFWRWALMSPQTGK